MCLAWGFGVLLYDVSFRLLHRRQGKNRNQTLLIAVRLRSYPAANTLSEWTLPA